MKPNELKELRRIARRYQALLEAFGAIAWTANADGEFVEPHAGWEKYTAQTWQDCRGRGWLAAVHPDDRDQLIRTWHDWTTIRTSFQIAARVWSATHRDYRSFRCTGIRLLGAEDDSDWLMVMTEGTRENEGRRVASEAAQAGTDKAHFLATVSHDLRQPLQTLAAVMGALRAVPHEADEARLIARADRAITNLTNLLNALVQLAQFESGNPSINLQSFSLEGLFSELRTEFEPAASAAELALVIEPTDLHVLSDFTLLKRMISNLLENAIRYTPPGGKVAVAAGRVAPTADGDGVNETVRITVNDTGIGLALERATEMAKAFRHFPQSEGDEYRVLGLGLSIVARLGALIDHPIDMNSELGRGSTFSISLPLSRPGNEDHVKRSNWSALGGRVLVVEDSSDVGEALTQLLELKGFETTLVRSADEAAQRLEGTVQSFQFLISDFRLPDRTGIEVAEMAVRRFPAIKPIILTGDVIDRRLETAREKGFRVLHKPVELETLLAALQSS